MNETLCGGIYQALSTGRARQQLIEVGIVSGIFNQKLLAGNKQRINIIVIIFIRSVLGNLYLQLIRFFEDFLIFGVTAWNIGVDLQHCVGSIARTIDNRDSYIAQC